MDISIAIDPTSTQERLQTKINECIDERYKNLSKGEEIRSLKEEKQALISQTDQLKEMMETLEREKYNIQCSLNDCQMKLSVSGKFGCLIRLLIIFGGKRSMRRRKNLCFCSLWVIQLIVNLAL